jgi:hypothetical protein
VDRKATGLPLAQGTQHIRAAMQRHGVRRYVGNATPSVLDAREHPTWQTRLPTFMAKTFLRRAYDEIVGMSQAVTTSGLDWTIVRFLAPKGGPAKGELRTGFSAPTGSASPSPAPTSPPSPPPRSTTPATSAPPLPSATDRAMSAFPWPAETSSRSATVLLRSGTGIRAGADGIS